MFKKWICALLILLCLHGTALAAPDTAEGFRIPVDIFLNGDFIRCTRQQKPFLENGTAYIPVRAFAEAVSAALSWQDAEQAAVFEKNGTELILYSDRDFILADGISYAGGAKLVDDILFAPAKNLCAPLGWTVTWDDFYLTLCIDAPGVSVAEPYKDFSYTFNDMLWLAKITHIECGSRSIAERIGVANTVLNRVASPLYPNTIPEAILDVKHGVQYPPAHTQKMQDCVPSKTSMIAAKAALNGVSLAGDSVAFVHVNQTASSWAANNMRRVATIGILNFYAF